ncbi:MAG: hypothetical protein NTX25_01690 [Proteobacteria bacterium]|nr:hypothetical protein [Pseudomonadota bacterium]
MDAQAQVRESLRWLEGLEAGNMSANDLFFLAEKLDPVLISLMIRFLRKKYPSAKPEAAGVLSRILDLTSTYPQLVKKTRSAEQDPISEWFLDTYSFSDFYTKPNELIQLLVDKLEG